MAEDAVGDEGDGIDNKTVKRTPLSKMLNVSTRYLIFLYSGKRWVSLDSFGYSWGS